MSESKPFLDIFCSYKVFEISLSQVPLTRY